MEIHKITEEEHIDAEIEGNMNFIDSLKRAAPLHTHGYFEFFLVTGGMCIHRANGQDTNIREGDLVFIRPDDVHCYIPAGDNDCEFINIACAKKTVREAIGYYGDETAGKLLLAFDPPVVRLLPGQAKQVVDCCERVKMLQYIDKKSTRLSFRRLISELLSFFLISASVDDENKMPTWFSFLLVRINRKENFTLGVQRLLELSEKSHGHLCRLFKEYLDMTPTEYINRLKTAYASDLMLISGFGITEAALEAGFENISHFYHVFKELTGRSPGRIKARDTAQG